MFFGKSSMHGIGSVLRLGRRRERARSRRGSATASSHARIARAFYCEVLRGRQVWGAEHDRALSFIVEGTRIDVSPTPAAERDVVVLPVLDPEAVAERCWDAGYDVRVGDQAAMSVIDPFGLRIDLVR